MIEAGQPIELNISNDYLPFSCVLMLRAEDLDDTSTVTVKDEPTGSGDVRALRGGVYVDIPRETFYTWLHSTIGVTAIVEPLKGWRPRAEIDFDDIIAQTNGTVPGLDGLATWCDGREPVRATMSVDELWNALWNLGSDQA